MKTLLAIFLSTGLVLAAMSLVSCEKREEAGPAPQSTAESASSSQDPVTFGEGFDKSELTPNGVLRWVRQESSLTVNAETAGKYRLTFRPITVFSPTPAIVEVAVNGQPAGTIPVEGSDMAKIPARTVEVPLQAGANKIILKSNRPDVPLSAGDSRIASFGLMTPVHVEKLP